MDSELDSELDYEEIIGAATRTQRMLRGWLIRRRYRQYVRKVAMGHEVSFGQVMLGR